jgi:predicted ATPase/DNA-binding SARP family transcriptional activator
MDQGWRIELLGGLRARQGERVVERFRQKAGPLLAYLAYSPQRSHSREALAETLWPELDPDNARNSLRVALHVLREQLDTSPPAAGVPAARPLVIANRTTIALDPAAFITDVREWQAALRAAARASHLTERVSLLVRAVELYGGEMLRGHEETWVLCERLHLAEEHLGALHRLVTALEELGDPERALEYARRAVAADPLREEAHYDLMRLYVAADQPSAMLRQYQELECLLREELGEAPSAVTRALADELRGNLRNVLVARSVRPVEGPPSGDATPSLPRVGEHGVAPPRATRAPPGTGTGRLPVQLTRFFGRDEEIARITEALHLPQGRLVTLTGPGGSGKTRLAIAAAWRLAAAFDGAVGFVPLAEMTPAPPDERRPRSDEAGTGTQSRLADVLAGSLGLACSPHADPLEQVIEALTGRPWLLVLDNVEHVAEEAARLLRKLLQRVPTLTALVTSRQRLGIDGEQEFALLPLPTPRRSDPPERLMEYASVQLFVDRARAVRPDFQVTVSNAAAVAELCDRLDGLPLALELAAARSQILSPSQMLAHLERRFDFLVSRQRDAAPRHRTLRAALDGSYQLLSPELRQFFARLSVFRGGWTLEAAAQVCAGEDGVPGAACRVPRPTTETERPAFDPSPTAHGTRHPARLYPGPVVDALAELRECSLILAEERGEELRYRMLETLREYAAEQLAAADGAALRRHALYFLSLAEQSEAPHPGVRSRTGVERLESEILNLRAALAWSLADESNAELGLRLVCRLRPLWRKQMTEGREWLATALARAPQASPVLRAEALHLAAQLAGLQNDLPAAGAALEESLALRRAVGDRAGIADVLVDLATWARGREEHGAAKAFLEECVVLRRELDDRPGVAWAIENLAWTAQQGGEIELARSLLQESLAIGREGGFLEIVAYTLHGLGWLAALHGDLAGARPLLDEGLEAARELARQPGAVSPSSALRRIWRELDRNGARFMLEQSLAFSRTLGQQWLVLHHLGALGHVARQQGDYERCAAYYRESLSLRREAGDLFTVAQSLEDFAGLAGRQDRHARAARLLGAADALCHEIGKRLPVAVPEEYERTTRRARAILGEAAFAAAWEQGRATPLEQAIEDALEDGPRDAPEGAG